MEVISKKPKKFKPYKWKIPEFNRKLTHETMPKVTWDMIKNDEYAKKMIVNI